MNSRKLQIAVVFLIAASLIIASCAKATEEPTEKELVKVTFRTPWIFNAQFTGPMVAIEKGFFADEGIEVELRPGGPDANSITLVSAGSEIFGSHDVNSLILARAEGLPLITVATFWQKHPGCVYARADSGITTLEDMEGMRIGFKEGGPWILTQAMWEANGIDIDSIEKISVGFGVAPLLENQVDMMTGFCSNEPLQLENEGYEAVTFIPFDYGIPASTEALFTTEDYWEQHPDVVCGMVRAIRRGWEYSLDNKEEAINIVLEYGGEELDFDTQMRQFENQIPLIWTPDSEQYGLGYMTGERWEAVKAILLDQGILETDIDVSQAYTLECLE